MIVRRAIQNKIKSTIRSLHEYRDHFSSSVYSLPQRDRTESSKGTRLTCGTVPITGTTKPSRVRNPQSAVTIPWENAPNHCKNHV